MTVGVDKEVDMCGCMASGAVDKDGCKAGSVEDKDADMAGCVTEGAVAKDVEMAG